MATSENLVPAARAVELLGLPEPIFWDAAEMAGVKEVLHRMRPHFRVVDLDRIIAAYRLMPKKRQRMIYIVRAGRRGHFKIGITMDFQQRLMELQVGCPVGLIEHHLEPGDIKLEKAIHRSLKAHCSRGEWFKASPEVMDFITRAKQIGVRAALAN